jgi:hypothetical protein
VNCKINAINNKYCEIQVPPPPPRKNLKSRQESKTPTKLATCNALESTLRCVHTDVFFCTFDVKTLGLFRIINMKKNGTLFFPHLYSSLSSLMPIYLNPCFRWLMFPSKVSSIK